MKTICVGRFLLDVPEKAVVTYRGASLSGWEISSWKENEVEFSTAQKEREAKLKIEKNSQGGISLELVRDVRHEDLHGKIFVFNRRSAPEYSGGVKTMHHLVAVQAYVRVANVTYKFESEFSSESEIKNLEEIIRKLKPRENSEIPVVAGFCFGQGFLNDPLTADQSEYTGIFLGLEDHPDLAIGLISLAGIDPGKTLIQRAGENSIKQEYRSHFHTFRQGQRSLNGVPGEEILERVEEPNGSMLQSFMWESLSKTDDVYLPNLVLEFSTGHGKPGAPVNSSMSDAEALALWNKISSSLRRRPVQLAKPV